MNGPMNAPILSTVLDPLDIEIIERAYEAAWAEVTSRYPHRDFRRDPEYKQALRRTLFAIAGNDAIEPEALCERALAHMHKPEECRKA